MGILLLVALWYFEILQRSSISSWKSIGLDLKISGLISWALIFVTNADSCGWFTNDKSSNYRLQRISLTFQQIPFALISHQYISLILKWKRSTLNTQTCLFLKDWLNNPSRNLEVETFLLPMYCLKAVGNDFLLMQSWNLILKENWNKDLENTMASLEN